MTSRASWSTRLGFYFAAIGSAFGLGNLWRFPYVVAESGGGAFVLLYVFLAFFVGFSLLMVELILGKKTQKSIVVAYSEILKRPENRRFIKLGLFFGKLSVLASLLVFSYYAVISGWVLHFFMQFFVGLFDVEAFRSKDSLEVLKSNGYLQVGLASVHILVATLIVARGLQNGLERWLGYLMPAFTVILVLLVVKSLSLPGTVEALRFLFYPDFSRLSLASLGHALGHMFFTLSVGFGVMVTFGSYLKRDNYIPESSFRVAFLDTGISLLSGLLIFPILFSFLSGGVHQDVLFETLPLLFNELQGGHVFGTLFFLCLYLAALGASIGLLEVVVSNLEDRRGINRKAACWIVGLVALLVSVAPALSSSVFSDYSLDGQSVLQILDSLIINWILPLVALSLCLIVGFVMSSEEKKSEFQLTTKPDYSGLYESWNTAIRWWIPLLIVVALVLQVLDLF